MDDWRTAMLRSAGDMVRGLPADEPVDLIAAFARPWSRELAMRVAGAPRADAGRLAGLAREVFLAAAHATDARPAPAALTATTELARALPGADPAIAVQAFVALSETLPCLLAGVWLELFRRPPLAQQLCRQLLAPPDAPGMSAADEMAVRDDSNHILPRVIEELMRLASPDRAVFRQARGDTTIGNARIAAGDGVILMLAAANRDPNAFPDPDAVDLSRSAPAHLTFGRGPHRCAGASLVRMAVTVATVALLETSSEIEVIGEVEWIGGFAIRGPAALPVVLRRQPPDGPSDPAGRTVREPITSA